MSGQWGSDQMAERIAELKRDCREESDNLLSAIYEIRRLERVNAALLEAAKRVGDRRMWRGQYESGTGQTVWEGVTRNGNEIETEDPWDILNAAIALAEPKP